MLSIGTTVLGVADFARALEFWTKALDYVPRDEVRPGDDFAVLIPKSGEGARLAIDLSESPVQEHPRVHLDLYAGDAVDQAAEVARLITLGASRVEWDLYPDECDFIVMADTEGNRFCVINIRPDGLRSAGD